MPHNADDRWRELTRHVADEILRDSQDPSDVLEPHELSLRLRARTSNDPPAWLSGPLSPEQLQTGILRRMAEQLYAS